METLVRRQRQAQGEAWKGRVQDKNWKGRVQDKKLRQEETGIQRQRHGRNRKLEAERPK